MFIFKFDKKTKRYIGQTEMAGAKEVPEKLTLPAGFTSVAPPSFGAETEIPVFDEAAKAWTVVKLAYFDRPSGNHEWNGAEWVLDLAVAKRVKNSEISNAWRESLGGSVMVSLGFPMQFDQKDVWAVRNVIEFAELTGKTSIYLTDSNNVNHEDISLSDAKTVLLEMGAAHLAAHQKKQALREQIGNADDVEALETVAW